MALAGPDGGVMQTNQARVSPDGFVAQRWPEPVNGPHWVLIRADRNDQMELKVLTDDDVTNWTRMVTVPEEVTAAATRLRADVREAIEVVYGELGGKGDTTEDVRGVEHAIAADMRTVLDFLQIYEVTGDNVNS